MAELVATFPVSHDWEYGLEKLRQAKWLSQPYLVKCLEVACQRPGDVSPLPAPYRALANHLA